MTDPVREQLRAGWRAWAETTLVEWLMSVAGEGIAALSGELLAVGESPPVVNPIAAAQDRAREVADVMADTAAEAVDATIRTHDRLGLLTEPERVEACRDAVGILPGTARQLGAVWRAALDDPDTPRSTARDLVRRRITARQATRAETVAEHEGVRAFSSGADQTIARWQAADPRRITRTWRVWHTRVDELVCPVCRPLDGRQVDFADDFGSDDVFGRVLVGPPAHPRCRCGTRYRYERADGDVTQAPSTEDE